MSRGKRAGSPNRGSGSKSPKNTVERPFVTEYAGSGKGHCISRESALIAGYKHMVEGQYSRCTITNKPLDKDVARLHMSKDRKHIIVDVVDPFLKWEESLRLIELKIKATAKNKNKVSPKEQIAKGRLKLVKALA